MVLVYRDGRPVKVGDKIKDFRGELWTVDGWEYCGPGRAGYVNVVDDERNARRFNVRVFDLEWKEE